MIKFDPILQKLREQDQSQAGITREDMESYVDPRIDELRSSVDELSGHLETHVDPNLDELSVSIDNLNTRIDNLEINLEIPAAADISYGEMVSYVDQSIADISARIDDIEALAGAKIENFRFLTVTGDAPQEAMLDLAGNFLAEEYLTTGRYGIILYNAAGNSQNYGTLYVSEGRNNIHQVLIFMRDANLYIYTRVIARTDLANGNTAFEWYRQRLTDNNGTSQPVSGRGPYYD